MNKKLLTVTFTLLLAILLSGAVSATDNGTSSNQSASTVQATTNTQLPDPLNTRTGISYTTIQAAIDSVFTKDGDTIICEAGTYNEDVLVWKDLYIVGDGTTTTFVKSFYINTDGSGSEITRFTITGGIGEAITLQDTDNCEIHGNVISGGYSAGVALINSDYNNINNNLIDDSVSPNYYGIYMDNSTKNDINSNIIVNSIFSGIWLLNSDNNNIGNLGGNNIVGNDDGIFLQGSNNNKIFFNTISGNTHDGIELSLSNSNTITANIITNNPNGIVLIQSNDNILGIQSSSASYNVISGTGATVINNYGIKITNSTGNILNDYVGIFGDNTKGFFCGVYLDNATSTIMEYINVFNCNTGIYVSNSSQAYLYSPWIKNCLDNGLWVVNSTATIYSVTPAGPQISGNGLDGILAISSTMDVSVAIIENNGLWGLHLVSCNDAIINDNRIFNNDKGGVYIQSCNNAHMNSNHITDNIGNGVKLVDSDNCVIDPSTITGNSEDGIFAQDSDNLQIENNNISSNKKDGIELDSCDNFNVNDNTIENNTENGLKIINSSGGTIDEQNIIDNNGLLGSDDGILLENSPEIIIRDNQIFTNGDDGVDIDNSNKVTIFQNNIHNNPFGVFIHGTSNDININFNRIVDNNVWDLLYTGTGDVDATLNWWGYNYAIQVADQINDAGTGDLNYEPWIVLSINANPNPVGIGGTTTITADLLHDSDSVYHNPGNGVVPYTGPANFIAVPPATITDVNFSNGSASSTLSNLNTPGFVDVTSTVDHFTMFAIVNVKPAATITDIIAASLIVKTYYESHSVLPATVNVGTTSVSMPQFLYLLVTASRNVNVGNLSPINIIPVNPAPAQGGSYTPGNIVKSSYLNVATNIQNFIITNGRAPNYAQTNLGRIPFNKLVYMYSKVINFYGINIRLPNYVTI